jgi:hypothetical protein
VQDRQKCEIVRKTTPEITFPRSKIGFPRLKSASRQKNTKARQNRLLPYMGLAGNQRQKRAEFFKVDASTGVRKTILRPLYFSFGTQKCDLIE